MDGFGSIGICPVVKNYMLPSENACGALLIAELEQLIWKEHLDAHWGSHKAYHAVKKRKIPVTKKLVKNIISQCEICAKFRIMVKGGP